MASSSRRVLPVAAFAVAALAALAASGCGEDEATHRRPRFEGIRPGQPSTDARERIKQQGAGLVEAGAAPADGQIALPRLSETDLIESPRRRDPFRPTIEVVVTEERLDRVVQREIKLRDHDISDLKLIGVITNISDPRAMVVTPGGEGVVLRRGDFVGRADFVDQGPGTERVQVNWKVIRIIGEGREEDRGIILSRDDPWTPTPDDITRFIPLHPRR